MKITMRMMPSTRFRISVLVMILSKNPPMTMGSRKNRPMESSSPMATAMPTMVFWKASLPSFFSSHLSNLDGSSCISSGARSADLSSAFTPTICASKKLKMPRINGQFFHEPGGFSFRGETSTVKPSLPRMTIASFSGPRIMMPSISA